MENPQKVQQLLKGHVFIATGASGGHIFPGLGIAFALRKQGYGCTFIGSGRQFTQLVEQKGFTFVSLPASHFNGRGVLAKVFSLLRMAQAVLFSLRLFIKDRPVAVLGMGSYASVAAVFAAWLLRIPTLVHEQNAKPGRANLFLARFVGCVMLTFESAKKYFAGTKATQVTVGSPVRAEILAYKGVSKPVSEGLHILILGGSQGSTVMAEIVPQAMACLPKALQNKMCVTQQARAADASMVKKYYQELSLKNVDIRPFFEDVPERLHKADLVITRAGTGILLELATLGRAAVIIPHELADGHQVENGRIFQQNGGAVMLREQEITPETLAVELKKLLEDKAQRISLEEKITLLAKPDAATQAATVLLNFAIPSDELLHKC